MLWHCSLQYHSFSLLIKDDDVAAAVPSSRPSLPHSISSKSSAIPLDGHANRNAQSGAMAVQSAAAVQPLKAVQHTGRTSADASATQHESRQHLATPLQPAVHQGDHADSTAGISSQYSSKATSPIPQRQPSSNGSTMAQGSLGLSNGVAGHKSASQLPGMTEL